MWEEWDGPDGREGGGEGCQLFAHAGIMNCECSLMKSIYFCLVYLKGMAGTS